MSRVRRWCHKCEVRSLESLCWVCGDPMPKAQPFDMPGHGPALESAEAAVEISVHYADGAIESY